MTTTQTDSQNAAKANIQTVTPNLYQLSGISAGQEIHIMYTTSSVDGKPRFTYQNGFNPPAVFAGDQIRRVENPDLGTIVSVTIHPTIDTGSTTLSLLIPRISLLSAQEIAPITAEAIITVHRIPLIPTGSQLDTYTACRLHGTARLVLFAAASKN